MNALEFKKFALKRTSYKYKIFYVGKPGYIEGEGDPSIKFSIPFDDVQTHVFENEQIVRIYAPDSVKARIDMQEYVRVLNTLHINPEEITIDMDTWVAAKLCKVLYVEYDYINYLLGIKTSTKLIDEPIPAYSTDNSFRMSIQNCISPTNPVNTYSKDLWEKLELSAKLIAIDPLAFPSNSKLIKSDFKAFVDLIQIITVYSKSFLKEVNKAAFGLLEVVKLKDIDNDTLSALDNATLFNTYFKEIL